jgi:hypothetical protein
MTQAQHNTSDASSDTPARRVDDPAITQSIHDLVATVGGVPDSFQGSLITQLIQTSLKLIPDGHDTGELKLLNRSPQGAALRDDRVFRPYARACGRSRIFGSARTPEDRSRPTPPPSDFSTAHVGRRLDGRSPAPATAS